MPIENDYATINRPCRVSEYGRACGGIVAQQLLLSTFDLNSGTFDLDDRYGLIDGYARVKTLPVGEAPDEIKAQVVDMSFPLRSDRPSVRGKVPVVHADLALTLMNSGRVEAANWYNNQLLAAVKAGKLLTWWHFRKSEVTVNKRFEPCDSLMEYDGSFSLSNPALWNSFIPPLFYARAARGEAVLPQTVPISLPDAPKGSRPSKKRRVRPRAPMPATEPAGRTIENLELPE